MKNVYRSVQLIQLDLKNLYKNRKYLIFQTKILEKTIITSLGKVQEIRMQRNLLEKMLGISLEKQIDVLVTLKYPLTPIPTSICHLDETMYKLINQF